MKATGWILIVVGIAMIVLQWVIHPLKESSMDAGPVQISNDEDAWIGWPTYAGAVISIAGIVLVGIAEKRRKS